MLRIYLLVWNLGIFLREGALFFKVKATWCTSQAFNVHCSWVPSWNLRMHLPERIVSFYSSVPILLLPLHFAAYFNFFHLQSRKNIPCFLVWLLLKRFVMFRFLVGQLNVKLESGLKDLPPLGYWLWLWPSYSQQRVVGLFFKCVPAFFLKEIFLN